MRLGKVRLQFQCPAVAGERFVQLALVLEHSAQVIVRFSIVRLQFQCPAVAGDRFVQLPLLLEHVPRLLCVSAQALSSWKPAKMVCRLFEFFLFQQSAAEVGVSLGHFGPQFQSLAQMQLRFLRLALSEQYASKVDVGVS